MQLMLKWDLVRKVSLVSNSTHPWTVYSTVAPQRLGLIVRVTGLSSHILFAKVFTINKLTLNSVWLTWLSNGLYSK